jgi:hypothetical protein
MWSKFVDACGVAGLAVGLVGLVITIKTFGEAKKAKLAAVQAAETVWRKNASTDFNAMSQRARELLGHIQNRQSDLAIARASDLLQSFQVAFGRWGKILLPESVQRLQLLQSQVKAISQSLSVDGIPSGEDVALYRELSERCHNLLSVLSEEAGRVGIIAEATENGQYS